MSNKLCTESPSSALWAPSPRVRGAEQMKEVLWEDLHAK